MSEMTTQPEVSDYTDDLAEVVDRAYYLGHGDEMGTVAADVTAAVLASDVLARMLAEAWQAGYLRGTLDNESDLEPADNPYQEN